VLDASRAVGVVGSLISASQNPGFVQQVRDDYERIRQAHQDRGVKPVLPIAKARANRYMTNWATLDIPAPSFLGVRTIGDQPLSELVPFIDWSPFFHTWELKGRYPGIFDDATVGPKAKELYDDARRLLDEIIQKTATPSYGSLLQQVSAMTLSSIMMLRRGSGSQPSIHSGSNQKSLKASPILRWPTM
jgi:5-methyltetrahydrofolate--homocysteine methyltransferase